MQYERLEQPGTTVFSQGQAADKYYMVLSGEIELTIKNESENTEVIRRLGVGKGFGELGCLGNKPRSGSALTWRKPCELLAVSTRTLSRVFRSYHEHMLARKIDFCRESPYFSGYSAAKILSVASALRDSILLAGDVLANGNAKTGAKQSGAGEQEEIVYFVAEVRPNREREERMRGERELEAR